MKFLNKKWLDKKGIAWQTLALAIIAIVVVILVILWFRGSGERGFGFLGEKIGELKDTDKDGVADMFDKCEGIDDESAECKEKLKGTGATEKS